MRGLRVIALIVGILVSKPGSATSARTIHPELVGFAEVALNFSPQTVPGLDTDALEKEIRGRLKASGLAVNDKAREILFVQIKYRRLPACPEYLVIQTRVAISEDVQVTRPDRSETVYVDTWKEDEDFVEPIGKAAEVASTSTLGLINYLLDARAYTTSVMAKGK
jgi:hypothetical protein